MKTNTIFNEKEVIKFQEQHSAFKTPDNNTDLWKNLSNNSNIEECSYQELTELMLALYSAQEISANEFLFITYDLREVNERVTKETGINFSPYYTQVSSDGKLNWISEYQYKLKLAIELGIQENITTLQKSIAIFQRLANS